MTVQGTPKYNLSESITLGRKVEYAEEYAPDLLEGVSRKLGRDSIGLSSALPFHGIDTWNGYELSWLNTKGKPQVAILRCYVPINSRCIIESKSFKLYLNSFNQTRIDSWMEVKKRITKDLSACAEAPVNCELYPLNQFSSHLIAKPTGVSIDNLDIDVEYYSPSAELLVTKNNTVSEQLYSDLLKSNCLITNQPDWASIMIRYVGKQIDHESLLKYLISFRQHNEFHEQCVERIFCDIKRQCLPEKLTVYARYTRRGGLDINPFRSDFEQPDADMRLPRQ